MLHRAPHPHDRTAARSRAGPPQGSVPTPNISQCAQYYTRRQDSSTLGAQVGNLVESDHRVVGLEGKVSLPMQRGGNKRSLGLKVPSSPSHSVILWRGCCAPQSAACRVFCSGNLSHGANLGWLRKTISSRRQNMSGKTGPKEGDQKRQAAAAQISFLSQGWWSPISTTRTWNPKI